MIKAKNLNIYFKEKSLIKNANFELPKGSLTCLLGPNGSGKSTLLRTLARMHSGYEGSIQIKNQPIEHIQGENLSKYLAVVLTDKPQVPMTVEELVSTGRFPYTSFMDKLTLKDKAIIDKTLNFINLQKYKSRDITTLSDGELQRAMIARALVQETPVILLDEPFSHLDIPHQVEILLLLKKLAQEQNKTILFSTHQWNFVHDVANQFLLIHHQKIIAQNPDDMISSGILEKVFHHKMLIFDKHNRIFKIKRQ